MNLEPFSHGNSLLHRADPRVKIIAALFLSLIIALCQNFTTATAGLVIALVLIAGTRLSPKLLIRRFLLVNSLNILLFIILPLTYSLTPQMSISGVHISLTGLHMAALITIKSNAILLLFVSLLATSTVASLGHGLQKLRVSPRLCMLLLFSYRYIFVIRQEYNRLYRAATLRCFSPATTLHTYKTYGFLLGMLLVKSWNRAARVQQAMELRGFTGVFQSLYELQMNITDYLLLTVFLGCGLILLIL